MECPKLDLILVQSHHSQCLFQATILDASIPRPRKLGRGIQAPENGVPEIDPAV
jgi:hypothetical protein